MKTLLKSFNLSDDAINIYLKGLGKFPYTFSEIKSIIPNVPENEVKQIVDDLIEKKLVLLVNPVYSGSIPHYIIIPPYSAILNNLNSLTDISDDKETDKTGKEQFLGKFRESLFKDLEKISVDLVDLLSSNENYGQTMDILSEVEENVKKFADVILNDVIEMISPLRMQSAVDALDLSKLITLVKQKISESEEIVANMFSQFREIVSKLETPNLKTEVDAFKTFIRELGQSIDKRIQELSISTGTPSSENIKALEKSLYTILSDHISMYMDPKDKFWKINSHEKIKEILSKLLEECKNELIIIVPMIEDFIPLEKLQLDYSGDESLNQNISKKLTAQKEAVHTGPSITKNQKKEIIEKIDATAKKVSKLKGFELSHEIADILAFISEINPESNVIDSIQGWLNRLLVIRKYLDSNTQYLLLEDIEGWKKDYSKIKKIEKKPEQEIVNELKSQINDRKAIKETESSDLSIKIISSDPHENKHALTLAKKSNIEYLQVKNNNIIAIDGDNTTLIFGVSEKNTRNSTIDITGFLTTYKPIIETLTPVLVGIKNHAKYPKEVEINRIFNDIIENINDFNGNKIAKKLKSLVDVVFEKDGISLDILELKLLIGKLEKKYQPLDNEMKEYVINELNKLNTKFSSLELIFPPEFRLPITEESGKAELETEITPPQAEPLDPEKLDNLFELLLERIGELKGREIGEQIEKFIEVILELHGYSNIIEWRNSLRNVDETLEEPFKEKIKQDLLGWKFGLLQQIPAPKTSLKEESADALGHSIQETPALIFEEEYISPGLTQSQFETEEESSSKEDENHVDLDVGNLNDKFNNLIENAQTLNGDLLSNKLQDIADILLQSHGAVAVNIIRQWISKLRSIKEPLEDEIKVEFITEIEYWKDKFA